MAADQQARVADDPQARIEDSKGDSGVNGV